MTKEEFYQVIMLVWVYLL